MGTGLFRFFLVAVLLSTITVSGYYRHRARQGNETIPRRREGLPMLAARMLLALTFLVSVAVHAIAPGLMTWATFPSPIWLRWGGVVLGFLTVPLVAWVLRSLGRNVSETVLTKSDHELVATGPYRWVRHPLYTTGVTLMVSLGLMAASWWLLGFALLAAVLVRYLVIPREERELITRFGARYEDYARSRGAMLPVLFR